jgi:integrase
VDCVSVPCDGRCRLHCWLRSRGAMETRTAAAERPNCGRLVNVSRADIGGRRPRQRTLPRRERPAIRRPARAQACLDRASRTRTQGRFSRLRFRELVGWPHRGADDLLHGDRSISQTERQDRPKSNAAHVPAHSRDGSAASRMGRRFVQRRLGHAQIQTTVNTYGHLSTADLGDMFARYQKERAR